MRLRLALCCAVLSASAAAADLPDWYLLSSPGIGSNHSAAHVELGWPGLTATAMRGFGDRFDFGVRLAVNIAFEDRLAFLQQGLKLELLFRWRLGTAGRWDLGVSASPGLFAYVAGGAGVTVPLSLTAAVHAARAWTFSAGVDAPLALTLTAGTLYLPALGGVGAEWHLRERWALTARARAGILHQASLSTLQGGNAFALEAQIGIGCSF